MDFLAKKNIQHNEQKCQITIRKDMAKVIMINGIEKKLC